MNNKRKYLGITIGPIIKTIQMARSTKELWGASYLFSYIMRSLIKHLGVNDTKRFITPYISSEDVQHINNDTWNVYYGAGVFPDRLVFDMTDLYEDKDIAPLIEKVKKQISNELNGHFAVMVLMTKSAGNLQMGFDQYQDFLNRYFKIYTVQLEIDVDKDKAVASKIFPLLEAIENQASIISYEQTVRVRKSKKALPNFLEYYLAHIHRGAGSNSTLYQKVFPDKKSKGAYGHLEVDSNPNNKKEKEGFPSIRDIATIELRELYEEKYTEAFNKAFKKEEEEEAKKGKSTGHLYPELYEAFNKNSEDKKLKQYHKYICIVHADGDAIGKAIKQLNEICNHKEMNLTIDDAMEIYHNLSKALSDFARKAAEIINKHAGKPVYIGGDDLLFFAPVRSKEGTIFELVEILSKCFDKVIASFIKSLKETIKKHTPQLEERDRPKFEVISTISFGVSMTYHKFPLFEAVERSRDDLLDGLAKKYKSQEGLEKNALAFRVSKHSTGYFQAVLQKRKGKEESKSAYEIFLRMMADKGMTIKQLSSLSYKLRDNIAMLYEIADQPTRIDAFFTNFFNESVHKTANGVSYIDDVKELLKALLKENLPIRKDSYEIEEYKREWQKPVDNSIKTLYGILRMINFLNQNASNEDE